MSKHKGPKGLPNGPKEAPRKQRGVTPPPRPTGGTVGVTVPKPDKNPIRGNSSHKTGEQRD